MLLPACESQLGYAHALVLIPTRPAWLQQQKRLVNHKHTGALLPWHPLGFHCMYVVAPGDSVAEGQSRMH